MASLAKPTSIYIDLVPGYKNLSICAEYPLSTMVRNMWNGCGDGSQLTSFSCFCTDSYSKFSWDISTAVVAGCDKDVGAAQATSAVGVFHSYCANGTTQLSTAALATTTSSNPVFTPPTTSIPKIGPDSTAGLTSAAIRTETPTLRLFILLIAGIFFLN